MSKRAMHHVLGDKCVLLRGSRTSVCVKGSNTLFHQGMLLALMQSGKFSQVTQEQDITQPSALED